MTGGPVIIPSDVSGLGFVDGHVEHQHAVVELMARQEAGSRPSPDAQTERFLPLAMEHQLGRSGVSRVWMPLEFLAGVRRPTAEYAKAVAATILHQSSGFEDYEPGDMLVRLRSEWWQRVRRMGRDG